MVHVTVDVYEQDVFDRDVVNLSDWEQAATHFVRSVLCLPLRDCLAAAQPAAWDTGLDLLDSDDPLLYHCGLVRLLHVVATTPNTGCAVAQRLLDEDA